MMMNLPEVDYSATVMDRILATLKASFNQFKLVHISFFDEHDSIQEVVSAKHLYEQIASVLPRRRHRVSIKFHYRRSKGKVEAIIVLDPLATQSAVIIEGGTRKIQDEESRKIEKVIGQYERLIPNSVGKTVLPMLLGIGGALLAYYAPASVFSFTPFYTTVSGTLGVSVFLFFHYRPHSLIRVSPYDYVRILPSFWRVGFIIACAAIFFLGLSFTPVWSGLDALRVADTPSLQVRVLRSYLVPAQLHAFEELESLVKTFDDASSPEQKTQIAKSLVNQIYEMIFGENGLRRIPLNKLDLFLSSAFEVKNGNWLQQPLLLGMKAGVKDGNGVFEYNPHVSDPDFKAFHQINLDKWLSEPVLSDKYGKIWTRESLIKALRNKQIGKSVPHESASLQRLKEFPDISLVFQVKDQKPQLPTVAVDDMTVRSIGDELQRSLYQMQRTVSATPTIE